MEQKIKIIIQGILLLAIVSIFLLNYLPATESRFLMDDFSNLHTLTEIKQYGMQYYVFSGFAGPTGRPLSLLSFALQADSWPSSPSDFKTVNLILHLINGILIGIITYLLSITLEVSNKQKKILSYCTAILWLIHPVHLSTIFYVTQRMTLLSAFFTLATILFYLSIRRFYSETIQPKAALIIFLIIMTGCVLATFSKEIGFLVLLYIIVIELTLFNKFEIKRIKKLRVYLFLVFPLVLLVIYFVTTFSNNVAGYEYRNYNFSHRLITQLSVLFDYLRIIVLPRYSDFTFYHDNYPIYKNIFASKELIFKELVIVSLLFAGLLTRKKIPVISFGILWFFSANLIESSHLNLEMFFEHRTYLSSYGLLYSIVWCTLIIYNKYHVKIFIIIFLILYSCFFYTSTRMHLNLWREPYKQTVEWARLNPSSVNALNDLVGTYVHFEKYNKAEEVLAGITKIKPDSIFPYIQNLKIEGCYKNSIIPDEQWTNLELFGSKATSYKLYEISSFDSLVSDIVTGKCKSLSLEKLANLIHLLISNPSFSHLSSYLHEYLATIELYRGNLDKSLLNIQEAYKKDNRPSYLIYEIRLLVLKKEYQLAQNKIIDFKNNYYENISTRMKYEVIINNFEKQAHLK